RSAGSRVQGMFIRHGSWTPPAELPASTAGRVRGFLTRPNTRSHITALHGISLPSRGGRAPCQRRIRRERLHAELPVGCSRGGIEFLCSDLIAAPGIDLAKCRGAKSSQRASF